MLSEQIFNTILNLTKKGFDITISYSEDRDTFKVQITNEIVSTSFQFTPELYMDAVDSPAYLSEMIESVANRIINK